MTNLSATGELKKHHIYLLLNIYSKFVDFSNCDPSNINLAIQLTSERCYNIQNLDFSHTLRIPKGSFNNLITQSTVLTKINISHTNIGNDTLSVISENCPELKYLDISQTPTSDSGLLCLAVQQDLEGRTNNSFGKCLNLVVLKLNGCEKISEKSVATLMTKLSKLRVLEYHDSISAAALAGTFKSDINLNLTCLNNSDEMIEETDVCMVILANSKSLESLNLTTFMEMSESTAFSILEADNLTKFSLTNEFSSHAVSFQQMFNPVVVKFGPQLTHLELSQICDININRLKDVCVCLEHLCLIWNKDYIENYDNTEQIFPYFQCLKYVKVYSSEIDPAGIGEGQVSNFPFLDLLSIISSPDLEEIHLLNCHNLLDETFYQAAVYSKFLKLKNLCLERCNNITYDGLQGVLQVENLLEQVKLVDCKEITKKDSIIYQNLAKKRRWNVNITWS